MSNKKFLATLQPDNTWYLYDSAKAVGAHGAHIDDCLKTLATEGDRVNIEISHYKPEHRPMSTDDLQWLTGTGRYAQ